MALGKTSKAYAAISDARLGLIEGVTVSIDPSIGSSSSLPGWAIYVAGKLRTSGVFEIDRNGTIPARLQQLAYCMRFLYNDWDPDVCVYEDIPAQRYGGGNANAHSSLLKSVGVVLSIPGPDFYVGILPISWKALAGKDYIKGDKEDAETIGRIAIEEAQRIVEEEGRKPLTRYGQRREKGPKAGPKTDS